ncbi:MAG: DNA polymerase IV [Chloroflexi bacterium]|uniref:DNA polymerase IV n=1 Tax=Candidatus Chlorohelix allophototropha TaxID=3003348 RepID=A0A8T7LRL9_9CHLR|nr:DNA polymerase IV [Chloroflexota bacterium]WJW66527.1 DNA polymerase IV [Chloroflexota bacterium L227-S17]
MDWTRCIAHLDLDAFYATVEEIMNPEIKGLPIMVIMGEDTTNRGVVATASYAARQFGVHSAMPVTQARRLCPDGIYLQVRHDLYKEFSRRVMQLLEGQVNALEQVSIDEAYLDLSGQPDPAALAQNLQEQLITTTGLSASVGIATNKLVAKMASGFKKPGGLTMVEPGKESEFLRPLPVGKLYGIGPKTAARLNSKGIQTIGDLAEADLEQLQEDFGPNLGLELHKHAAGHDDRSIETSREAKSFSYERTYFVDVTDSRRLWKHIQEMAAGLENQLKKRGLLARTTGIKLRFADWRTVTRAETLLSPTDNATTISASAARLMKHTWKRGTPLRLLGVRVSNFIEVNATRQLQLPLEVD